MTKTAGSLPIVDSAEGLLAERQRNPDEVWDAAERLLDQPIAEGLNIAHEACDRWGRDRSRLAIVVAHEDGTTEHWTFADLSRASRRFANALTAAGLKRGDRVAAVVGRQIEAYIGALSAWRAGMVYMPLFSGFGEQALAQRLNAAEVSAVVVDHHFRDVLERAQGLLKRDPPVFCIAAQSNQGMRPDDVNFWEAIDRSSPDFSTVKTVASDLSTLLFTSGTTGDPKGCMMPHELIVSVQPFVRHTFNLRQDDLLFAAADPGWGYGLITTGVSVMALGLPRVIYSGPFEPQSWLELFEREQITFLSSAPSAYRGVLAAADTSGLAESIRGATSAGEPLDAPLAAAWNTYDRGELQDGYGSTELGMVLGNLAYDETSAIPGALSSAVPGFEVGLVDREGNQVDGEGIIAIRPPRYQPTNGYWNEAEKWQARFKQGWHLSGDLARRDNDGRWWFLSRDDDLIITSGYNVGPSEVESIILAVAGVREAAAVAAPDAAKGSVVRAVVVASPDCDRAELVTEIQGAVRSKLGRHAYPRIVDFTDVLPRTETGKLKRSELRGSS
jgi:acetyl-CoA synthetase